MALRTTLLGMTQITMPLDNHRNFKGAEPELDHTSPGSIAIVVSDWAAIAECLMLDATTCLVGSNGIEHFPKSVQTHLQQAFLKTPGK